MRVLKCRYCGTEDLMQFDDKQKNSNKMKTLCCLECKKRRKKDYDAKRYVESADDVKMRVKKYSENNKSVISERRKEYRNRPEIVKRRHEYWINNREHLNRIRWKNEKERLKTDSSFAMQKRLRNNLLAAVKKQPRCNNRKPASIFELLGCSLDEFKVYFERQFKDGMSWEMFCNSDSIHIDHIIPVCLFDLSDLDQAKKCFHYTNLQPLWKWENIAKGANVE